MQAKTRVGLHGSGRIVVWMIEQWRRNYWRFPTYPSPSQDAMPSALDRCWHSPPTVSWSPEIVRLRSLATVVYVEHRIRNGIRSPTWSPEEPNDRLGCDVANFRHSRRLRVRLAPISAETIRREDSPRARRVRAAIRQGRRCVRSATGSRYRWSRGS
jgi:hypothetical protein